MKTYPQKYFIFILFMITGFIGGALISQNMVNPTTNTTPETTCKASQDTIDCVNFSTYFGGSGIDLARKMVIDSQECIIIVGESTSSSLHTESAIQQINAGGIDAFVVKLSPDGQDVIFFTFLGGTGDDVADSVVVDINDSIIVGGFTNSLDFPLVNPIQPENHGGSDFFITKITNDGSTIEFSSYFGGSGDELNINNHANGIAVDNNGNIIYAGNTDSGNFPTVNAYQNSNMGGEEVALFKISPNGQEILFSTYFGGTFDENAGNIAIDLNDRIILTGTSISSNLPVVKAYQSTRAGNVDGFIAVFGDDGQNLEYCTYFGGAGAEFGFRVFVDSQNSIILTGTTFSFYFPASEGQYEIKQGTSDAFITKFTLDPTNFSMQFSKLIGGLGSEWGFNLAIDHEDNIFLCGQTEASGYPVQDPIQAEPNELWESMSLVLSPTGENLLFSTYIGGAANDFAYDIGFLNSSQSMIVVGFTESNDFFTQNALDQTFGGNVDTFVMRIELSELETYEQYINPKGIPGYSLILPFFVGSIAFIILKHISRNKFREFFGQFT